MQSSVLTGAQVKLFIANKLYQEVSSIRYMIDYGETETYGIDSAFPQEIAPSQVRITGTVYGVRVKRSGGLQGSHIRPLIKDILPAPYISLEVRDRVSSFTILYLPQAKISNERVNVTTNGIVTVTFNFKAIVPYNTLDVHR